MSQIQTSKRVCPLICGYTKIRQHTFSFDKLLYSHKFCFPLQAIFTAKILLMRFLDQCHTLKLRDTPGNSPLSGSKDRFQVVFTTDIVTVNYYVTFKPLLTHEFLDWQMGIHSHLNLQLCEELGHGVDKRLLLNDNRVSLGLSNL